MSCAFLLAVGRALAAFALSARRPMAPGFHSPAVFDMVRGCLANTASDAALCGVRKHPPDGGRFPVGESAQWRARKKFSAVRGTGPEACDGIGHAARTRRHNHEQAATRCRMAPGQVDAV